MMRAKAIISAVLLLMVIIVLNTKFGQVPPVGAFLDPQGGFWANAETSDPRTEELTISGLKQPVQIYYDERRVPHIFAQNDYDLYLAQGFVVARDRLFQMELQTYDAAGRLAEITGASNLERDRNTRRWGMVYGAEKAMEEINKDPASRLSLEAYAAGVNAYISSLSEDEYPLEYKILDISPEEWTPLKSALLLMNMSRTLSGRSSDNRSSNSRAYFGSGYLEKWFNTKPALNAPVIPPSREWDFETDIPEAPDSVFIPKTARQVSPMDIPEGIGSNNWAVSGDKTASGYPILANDPHLTLTLPSIWYEAQLTTPDLNTYGVTLQGAPGIVIGFNEKVAWGVTNVAADVLDWYEITFRDENRSEYLHDGKWKPVSYRIEKIKVRGGETVTDTVRYTHHGPVHKIYPDSEKEGEPGWHAMRWVAHDGSNDLKTFHELNRAENYEDYVAALSHYNAPAQNFVFASSQGDIAIRVTGKFPKKWDYQGREVSDGSDPAYDWQGWIPHNQVPHVKNPPRGFVSSANQESAAPNYPYYLNDDYAPYERGRRINDLLGKMDEITAADMQNMQMDDYSYYAATLLPSLLQWTDTTQLDNDQKQIYRDLENWDYTMDAEKTEPSVFRSWASDFYAAVFFDEFDRAGDALLRYPPRDRFVEVIKEQPGMSFTDNVETAGHVETREELALESFQATTEEMQRKHGEYGVNWQWGKLIYNDIHHLAFIPGLGEYDVFSSGSSDAINATRGRHGPSWRMVVELGPEVKGYGVYPGGASGNPGSPFYDHMLESWRTGELFELQFMKEKPDAYMYRLDLKN